MSPESIGDPAEVGARIAQVSWERGGRWSLRFSDPPLLCWLGDAYARVTGPVSGLRRGLGFSGLSRKRTRRVRGACQRPKKPFAPDKLPKQPRVSFRAAGGERPSMILSPRSTGLQRPRRPASGSIERRSSHLPGMHMSDELIARRAFLLTAATGVAGVTRAAQAPRPRTSQTTVKLGVASYSLREFSRADAITMIRALRTPYVNIKSVHLPY